MILNNRVPQKKSFFQIEICTFLVIVVNIKLYAVCAECYNKNNEWSYIRTTYNFEELTNKDIKDIEAENTMLCFKPQPNDFCMVNVKKSTREILMISKDGNIVNTFTSINQAQLKTGIYNIWPCVNHIGKHKTAGGYYWKFKDEYEDTI